MAKAVPLKDDSGVVRGYMIFCPGCNCGHMFHTNHTNPKSNWTFNGDTEKPTFSPSMLVYANSGDQKRCHSFVRDGRIQFLDDCEHSLKGKTVDLPDV